MIRKANKPCPVCGGAGEVEEKTNSAIAGLLNATCVVCGWHYTDKAPAKAKKPAIKKSKCTCADGLCDRHELGL